MNFHEKKVSIIVPIYNGELYITKCVESLLKQTYRWIEIILVNDGSVDGTYQMCLECANKNENIKFIDKANEGVSVARLAGLNAADSEYISFVDVDDWIDDDYIEHMMFELSDADIILAGISRILSDENFRILEEKNNIAPGVFDSKELLEEFFGKMLCFSMPFKSGVLPYACNKIYKKEILQPLMTYVNKNINDGEDAAIIFPYLIRSKKIVLSDYCGYKYLIHKNSACNQKRNDAYNNASLLYLWLYEVFIKSPYKDILLPQLRNYFLRMVWKRDPGVFIETNEFVFPFNKIKINSDIVIYGAGDVGKAYYIQIKQSNYCNIVAWADKNITYSDWMKCKVIQPREIIKINFDYVIVAIRSEYVCRQVYTMLTSMGIDKEKIILCEAGVENEDSY